MSPNAFRVTERVKNIAMLPTAFQRKKVFAVEPGEDDEDTLRSAMNFMQSAHRSGLIGFEIHYDSDITKFNLVSLEQDQNTLRTHFKEEHRDASLGSREDGLDLSVGDYVAATELQLTNDYWYPLNGLDPDEDFRKDPYSHVLTTMGESGSSDVGHFVQFLAVPVIDSFGRWRWSLGGALSGFANAEGDDGSEKAMDAVGKFIKRLLMYEPEDVAQDVARKDHDEAAERLVTKDEDKRFAVVARLISHGPEKKTVEQEMTEVAKAFDDQYGTEGRRNVIPQGIRPSSSWFQRSNTEQLISDVVGRFHPATDTTRGMNKLPRTRFRHLRKKRKKPFIVSANVLGALCHLPDPNDVNELSVKWSRNTDFGSIPADAPQFDSGKRDMDDDDWA